MVDQRIPPAVTASDELWSLAEAMCRGTVTPDETARLDLLLADKEAQLFYVLYLRMHGQLLWHWRGQHDRRWPDEPAAFETQDTSPILSFLRERSWQIAEYASKPAVLSVLVALLSVTCLLLALALIVPRPANPSSINRPTAQEAAKPVVRDVAWISRLEDCRWDSPGRPLAVNDMLGEGQRLQLAGGRAELTFTNGIKILVQAPAVLVLESVAAARLEQGRITARVPSELTGFTVYALGLQVVDLGTEFAVAVDPNSRTVVHVFVGKVEVSGEDPESQLPKQLLTAGMAIEHLHQDGTIRRIDSQAVHFERLSPADNGSQERTLDLADVVGGGDGTGTGFVGGAISQLSGRAYTTLKNAALTTYRKDVYRRGAPGYHAVQSRPLVDGTFVPGNPDDELTQITEFGLDGGEPLRVALPHTSGMSWDYIENVPNYQSGSTLDGIDYNNTLGHRMIALHANGGITFDLDAIETANPGWQVRRFTCVAGLANRIGTAKFSVYVDGQLHSSKAIIDVADKGKAFSINIAIGPRYRFLTLISTDVDRNIHHDRIIFGDPRLTLRPE